MGNQIAGGLAGCAMAVRYIGGLIIHVWTILLVFKMWGGLWGVVSIFLPGIATVVVCFSGIGDLGLVPFFVGTVYGLAILIYLAAFVASFVFIGMASASEV